jgi:two-component system, chemotaxis family, protein-glutamate methylesterase/glutaminase
MTYAAALRGALEYDGNIEVVDSAVSGEEALAAVHRHRPDVVTMDIQLPGMTGLQAVEQIMGTDPCPIVVISSHVGPASETAAAALAAGALDSVSKEGLDVLTPSSPSAQALRTRIKQISHIRAIRHPRARIHPPLVRKGEGGTASVIGICASTGGPQALRTVLAFLPADFPIPVFVVQHMTPGFTEGLVRWLDGSVPVAVGLAGERADPGVWIAPEGAHLRLGEGGTVVHDHTTAAGRHRPSGDVLLASLAEIAGNRAVAVVLSGMGRDGAIGAAAIRDIGGTVLAQNEESCVVYGMPQVAAEEAHASVLALEDIGVHLSSLVSEPLKG